MRFTLRTPFAQNRVHRPDIVDVTTRTSTSHDDGFIKIGVGFIVHDSSLYPARTEKTIFNAGFSYSSTGYSSIGEPQKFTAY